MEGGTGIKHDQSNSKPPRRRCHNHSARLAGRPDRDMTIGMDASDPLPWSAKRAARALSVSLCLVADCLRGLAELALARRDLAHLTMPQIAKRNLAATTNGRPADPAAVGDGELVARVVDLLPRLAARVPWRSDCLVSALAAQRWLAGKGVATVIEIGARRDAGGKLDAHAWLNYGDKVIIGGSVAGYVSLFGGADSMPSG